MKICLIAFSHDDAGFPSKKLPDLSRYIPKSRHAFVARYLTRSNARAEIDQICEEKFDIFMNYMCGTQIGNVAELEATKYLESKGVVILTNPSNVLARTRSDFLKDVEKLCMPHDNAEKFPQFVKYSIGCESLKFDQKSTNYVEDQHDKQVAYLKKEPEFSNVHVHSSMTRANCSVIVLEMGREVVALAPLKYINPKSTPIGQSFPEYQSGSQVAGFEHLFLVGGSKSDVQRVAVDIFKALDVNGAGWARVDVCLEEETGNIYAINVDFNPDIFRSPGQMLTDDVVIGEKFPGGHAAFFDTLLATKQMQIGWHAHVTSYLASWYNDFAPSYHSVWDKSAQGEVLNFLAANFDFSGSVLDLACGTGVFGRALHTRGIAADITGIEISRGMLTAPSIQKYYKQPIRIGPMQELIMGAGKFDHISCFGAFHFLEAVTLNAVLARMFMLARRSVTFQIDDLDDHYKIISKKNAGELFVSINHVETIKGFGTSLGWKQVYCSERQYMYSARVSKTDVYGYVMRYEKL